MEITPPSRTIKVGYDPETGNHYDVTIVYPVAGLRDLLIPFKGLDGGCE